MENYENDMEIETGKLLYHIVKHWRIIIIFGVICALLADLFAIYKKSDPSLTERSEIESETLSEDHIAELNAKVTEARDSLSDYEAGVVEKALSTYIVYEGMYTDSLNYMNNSLLTKINPYKVPTLKTSYLIDTDYKVTYPEIVKSDYTNSILEYIGYNLESEDVLNKVCKSLDLDVEKQYVRELYTISRNSDARLLTIYTFGESKEQCQEIMDILTKQLPNIKAGAEKQFDSFSMNEISSSYSETYSGTIQNAYQTTSDRLNNIYKNMLSLTSAYTSDQKEYLYALAELNMANNDPAELSDAELSDAELSDAELSDVNGSSSYINMKYLLLGFAGGVFVICMLLLIQLILSDVLISPSNLKDQYGLLPLGYVNLNEDKKRLFGSIDILLRRVLNGDWIQFSYDESVSMIVETIQITAETKQYNSLYITSSAEDSSVKALVETIQHQLNTHFENISSGASIVYSPDSVKKMLSCDAVVFIEKELISHNSEIDQELYQINNYNCPALGYVIIK